MLRAARLLLFDLAATLLFAGVLMATGEPALAIAMGMAFGVAQSGWLLARLRRVEPMQAFSLFLVLASGLASLLTRDPRFVMLKPSLIYLIVGLVMLKPGWMTRYLPPVAVESTADVATVFGFIWAGLMFVSAALNLAVALRVSPLVWGALMSGYAVMSKAALFLTQYGVMKFVAVRRRRRALTKKPRTSPSGAFPNISLES